METDRSQAKLDQILVAAKKRFGSYGIAKTTMNDIAADIGLSKASLYYYFKDKETLFVAVIEREQESFVKEMEEVIKVNKEAAIMLEEFTRLRNELFKKLFSPGKFSNETYTEMKPFFHALFLSFRKKELKMVIDILKKGVNGKRFLIKNLKGHAAYFLDTLKGLRYVVFSGPVPNVIPEISPKKFRQLEQHSSMFVQHFIQAISV